MKDKLSGGSIKNVIGRSLSRARYAAAGAAIGGFAGGLFSRSMASTGAATGALIGALVGEKRHSAGGFIETLKSRQESIQDGDDGSVVDQISDLKEKQSSKAD